MDAPSEKQLGTLFGSGSPRNHRQPTRSRSTFSISALRFDTRGDTTPASAGALPRRGGDGMDVFPSQMSDSQEGPGIHGTGNAGAGQALLRQTWPDPAERPRKPQPGSFHLSRSCQPHTHQDEGMCWKSQRGLANKEPDSPPELLMAATESTGETGQRK